MEHNKIGEYIKEKRKAQGLTQQALGDLLSVTDKAVSKWERNIGLPDITILNKLAKVLNTTVSNILNGQDDSSEVVNLEKEISKITSEIKYRQIKEKRKYITIFIVFILIIILLILGNTSFGYYYKKVNYKHFYEPRDITIGVPKTSFMMKYHDKSYSFKNFRNKSILEKEIKDYLKTLDYLTCNDTIYYYNHKDNFSITNYSVDNHILYNTITYTITDNDFCVLKDMNKYSEKLGRLSSAHSMNSNISMHSDWNEILQYVFFDNRPKDKTNIYSLNATIKVNYLKRINEKEANRITLEESIGTFEIKDNKLYYYRKEILDKSNDISIPEVSVFKLENNNMILIDNYLTKYYSEEIVLK